MVGAGFVVSLARPGGNTTGISMAYPPKVPWQGSYRKARDHACGLLLRCSPADCHPGTRQIRDGSAASPRPSNCPLRLGECSRSRPSSTCGMGGRGQSSE
jgi:hypothetical protein